MLSRQEEMLERQRTLENDRKVRDQQREPPTYAPDQSVPPQATTFHQHALSDANIPRGRFSQVETSTVIGSKADISGAYPAGPAWSSDPGSQLVEPPLGYRVNDLNPSDPEPFLQAQAPDPTSADAPSSPLRQRTGVGSSFRRFR